MGTEKGLEELAKEMDTLIAVNEGQDLAFNQKWRQREKELRAITKAVVSEGRDRKFVIPQPSNWQKFGQR